MTMREFIIIVFTVIVYFTTGFFAVHGMKYLAKGGSLEDDEHIAVWFWPVTSVAFVVVAIYCFIRFRLMDRSNKG